MRVLAFLHDLLHLYPILRAQRSDTISGRDSPGVCKGHKAL